MNLTMIQRLELQAILDDMRYARINGDTPRIEDDTLFLTTDEWTEELISRVDFMMGSVRFGTKERQGMEAVLVYLINQVRGEFVKVGQRVRVLADIPVSSERTIPKGTEGVIAYIMPENHRHFGWLQDDQANDCVIGADPIEVVM